MLDAPKLRRNDELTPPQDKCEKCTEDLIDCICGAEKCKICGEYLDYCACEKLPEDHSGESLCETCKDKVECGKREDEPRILQAQFFHCHDTLGRADFHPNEKWIYAMQEEGRKESGKN